jgi:hypothetical protein
MERDDTDSVAHDTFAHTYGTKMMACNALNIPIHPPGDLLLSRTMALLCGGVFGFARLHGVHAASLGSLPQRPLKV